MYYRITYSFYIPTDEGIVHTVQRPRDQGTLMERLRQIYLKLCFRRGRGQELEPPLLNARKWEWVFVTFDDDEDVGFHGLEESLAMTM